MSPRVILYGRPGCHLCDQAREELWQLAAAGHRFELSEVNIEEDDDLHKAMLERIPVIELDGRIVSELADGAEPLIAALAHPGTFPP